MSNSDRLPSHVQAFLALEPMLPGIDPCATPELWLASTGYALHIRQNTVVPSMGCMALGWNQSPELSDLKIPTHEGRRRLLKAHAGAAHIVAVMTVERPAISGGQSYAGGWYHVATTAPQMLTTDQVLAISRPYQPLPWEDVEMELTSGAEHETLSTSRILTEEELVLALDLLVRNLIPAADQPQVGLLFQQAAQSLINVLRPPA